MKDVDHSQALAHPQAVNVSECICTMPILHRVTVGRKTGMSCVNFDCCHAQCLSVTCFNTILDLVSIPVVLLALNVWLPDHASSIDELKYNKFNQVLTDPHVVLITSWRQHCIPLQSHHPHALVPLQL